MDHIHLSPEQNTPGVLWSEHLLNQSSRDPCREDRPAIWVISPVDETRGWMLVGLVGY